MTDKEKAIVMAYTGVCMLTGDKFQIFHKYVEDIMGRPVMTHELLFLGDDEMEEMLKDFAKVLHDLEWWCSSDISEENYRQTVKEFKNKWFKGNNKHKTLNEQRLAEGPEPVERKTTKEILNEMAALKARLNSLEKEYDALTPPNKRWRANKSERYHYIENEGKIHRYYYINDEGKICSDFEQGRILDDLRYSICNYFKTTHDAHFEKKRLEVIGELRQWATPVDDFNWENNVERKYFIALESGDLKLDYVTFYQTSELYFRTEEIAENAIKAVGENRVRKYYFRRQS